MNNDLKKHLCNSTKVLCSICLVVGAFAAVVSVIYYNSDRFETTPSIPVVINTWAFTDSTAKSNFLHNLNKHLLKLIDYNNYL